MNTGDVRAIYNAEDRTGYESERWSSSPVAESGFLLTKEAIERLVLPSLANVHEYLELGPGPGTWTKLLLGHMTGVRVHLVDISRTMLDAARKNLSSFPDITYTESDFLAFRPQKAYDAFFSSRALEYFPDKAPAVEIIARSLKKGGRAYLITKMPHYARMRILGKHPNAFHGGQISPKELSDLLARAGMLVKDIRPVFIVAPGVRSASLNLFLTRILRAIPWNPISASVSESYMVIAEKI